MRGDRGGIVAGRVRNAQDRGHGGRTGDPRRHERHGTCSGGSAVRTPHRRRLPRRCRDCGRGHHRGDLHEHDPRSDRQLQQLRQRSAFAAGGRERCRRSRRQGFAPGHACTPGVADRRDGCPPDRSALPAVRRLHPYLPTGGCSEPPGQGSALVADAPRVGLWHDLERRGAPAGPVHGSRPRWSARVQHAEGPDRPHQRAHSGPAALVCPARCRNTCRLRRRQSPRAAHGRDRGPLGPLLRRRPSVGRGDVGPRGSRPPGAAEGRRTALRRRWSPVHYRVDALGRWSAGRAGDRRAGHRGRLRCDAIHRPPPAGARMDRYGVRIGALDPRGSCLASCGRRRAPARDSRPRTSVRRGHRHKSRCDPARLLGQRDLREELGRHRCLGLSRLMGLRGCTGRVDW